MGPENFGWGGWWIFPMIMCIVMIVVAFMIFGRGGFKPPWGQGSGRDNSQSTESETALEILKKRYAKGEIKKEEFEQMKKDLEGQLALLHVTKAKTQWGEIGNIELYLHVIPKAFSPIVKKKC